MVRRSYIRAPTKEPAVRTSPAPQLKVASRRLRAQEERVSDIRLVRSEERDDWSMLVDPPGEIPSGGAEREVFTSADGRFVTGLWSREPDTWSFERPYDEVALILSGSAEVESEDGRLLGLGAGDVMVTPTGSKGTWRIGETITKFYAIYSAGTAGDDTSIRLLGADEPVEWIVLENAPGDENPP